MKHVALQVTHPCRICSSDATTTHVQSFSVGPLRYSAGTRCRACGYSLELDGPAPPEDVRARLLEAHGRWSVRLAAAGPRHVEVVLLLCEMARLEKRAAVKLSKTPNADVFVGTVVECAYWAAKLGAAGAAVDVVAALGVS